MSIAGRYLYGFTDRAFQPPAELRGLRAAPVDVLRWDEVAAVVSEHPAQRLAPSRSNIEPHHRVVREISHAATLVPAAFGHVSDSADDILSVLRANHGAIRSELDRLANTCELTVKMSWTVGNIFDHMVRVSRELRETRDRAFRGRTPTMNERLQIGAMFEGALNRERERLVATLKAAVTRVTVDVAQTPPRDEKTICQTALLVERQRIAECETALRDAAAMFDATVAIEYSGPWPTYSFVQLHLHTAETPAAA